VKHRDIKVLILPVNIVSIPSLTTFYLNKKGIQAKCITYLNSTIHQNYENTIHIPAEGNLFKNPILILKRIKLYLVMTKYYLKADIIHWIHRIPPPVFYWKFLSLISKSKIHFVEFLGTDTRIPSKLMQINKYYKKTYYEGYEYAKMESDQISYDISKVFHSMDAIPLLVPEMLFYNRSDFFPKSYLLFQRIDLSQFEYQPFKNENEIIIVHSPTKEITKGSKYVEHAINILKNEFSNLKFIKVINKTREENIEIVKHCDIFLDQFVVGGYGMASTEAMALGKPVMCFLLDELFSYGLPKECPIINTNPDQIYNNLKKLVMDQNYRKEMGERSRAYVEKYHDADKVCDQLIEIYKKELDAR
jgi:hypothetical protein